jgi:hypothetical protein
VIRAFVVFAIEDAETFLTQSHAADVGGCIYMYYVSHSLAPLLLVPHKFLAVPSEDNGMFGEIGAEG